MAGTAYWHNDHWDVRITLPGGQKSPPVHLPPDVLEEQARQTADAMHKRAREKLAAKEPTVAPQSCDAYAKRLFAHRRATGYTSVRQDESRWRAWASAEIGALAIADVTSEDVECIVRNLDTAIREKRILPKTAALAWGVVTSVFNDACTSKIPDLRVRPRGDNPTRNVQGPDSDTGRACGWIYPVEATQLLECNRIPLRWRRLFALSIYLYPRPGELEALEITAIDLLGGYVSIHQAADRSKDKGATKRTKTRSVRRVPIEPAILPLLETMMEEARAAGQTRLVTMPPVCDLAASLRRYLRRAGITRDELFANDEARRPIRFYDLRATGITWRALRGDLPLAIQRAAGHESLETTQGYIRAAADVGLGVGDPFPRIPSDLLTSEEPKPEQTAGNTAKAGSATTPTSRSTRPHAPSLTDRSADRSPARGAASAATTPHVSRTSTWPTPASAPPTPFLAWPANQTATPTAPTLSATIHPSTRPDRNPDSTPLSSSVLAYKKSHSQLASPAGFEPA